MSATNSQNGATAKDVASGRFSDPLGLLNLFNRAFSSDETKLDCSGDDWEPNLACQINAEKDLSDLADSSMMAEGYLLSAEQSIVKKSDVMDKVKLHADEFKRNGLRRRWEHARTAVQKKRTQENTLIDSPPPLYKSVRYVSRDFTNEGRSRTQSAQYKKDRRDRAAFVRGYF